jgi:hypothetical protein
MKFQAKLVTSTGALVAIVNGKQFTIDKSHANWHSLHNAFKENRADDFVNLVDVVATINQAATKYSTNGNKVEVRDEVVYYNNRPLQNSLTDKMLGMLRDGHDIKPMVLFLENLLQNPSKRAVDELYNFLEHKGLGITEDGCFLAYKAVRENYLDKYSGTISNKPGTVVEVQRNTVDDDASRHCSHGLHVGCLAYSGPTGWYHTAGDKVLIVKVNPKDAVSVPTDHNFTKLRTCKYEVVGEFKGELNKSLYSGLSVGSPDYDENEFESQDEDEIYDDYIDSGDLEEGDIVSFDYESHGSNRRRYVEIEEIDWSGDLVKGKLVLPEQDCGEYRSFDMTKMENIKFTS